MQGTFPLAPVSGETLVLSPTWIPLVTNPDVFQPFGTLNHVLGVWQSVFSTRPGNRKHGCDPRVSHTTMSRIMREVAAQAGTLLITAACPLHRVNFETIMTQPTQELVRPLCFPQGYRDGTHETIIPAVLVPLVVARMPRRFRESSSTSAFQQFLGRWNSFVLAQPPIDGMGAPLIDRLLHYVSVFSANWGPLAPHEDFEYEDDADRLLPPGSPMSDGALTRAVEHLDDATLGEIVLEMIRHQQWTARITYRTRSDSLPLCDGVLSIPGQPLHLEIEEAPSH